MTASTIPPLTPEMFSRVSAVLFRSAKDRPQLQLAEGQAFIVLVRDVQPASLDLGPGPWIIGAEHIAPGSTDAFPLAVLIVPRDHMSAWESLSVEMVGRMIDRIERTDAEVRAEFERQRGLPQ